MRDPSIHITESNLRKILKEFDMDVIMDKNFDKFISQFMGKAKLYSVSNRSISVTNKTLEKKTNRVLNSTIADTELFSQLLLHTRRKLKHQGLVQIKPGSRDWLILKEIVSLANEFCETFSLEKREGYIHFINIGVSKMNKFMLVKFTPMGSSIIETFQAQLDLQDDDKPKETEKMYNFYVNQILSKTGIPIDYTKNPDKYIYFYKARVLAKGLGVDALTYIKAQFYALEWRNGYPDPIQLIGDKAVQYLNKYLFENKISVKKPEEKSKIDWKKIKSLGNDE
jgi:hypothetical protein